MVEADVPKKSIGINNIIVTDYIAGRRVNSILQNDGWRSALVAHVILNQVPRARADDNSLVVRACALYIVCVTTAHLTTDGYTPKHLSRISMTNLHIFNPTTPRLLKPNRIGSGAIRHI